MTALALGIELRREDVLHFLGYGGRGVPGPRIEEALGLAIEEARPLAVPRGVHGVHPPGCAGPLGLEIRPGGRLALGLVTIGDALERQVTSLLAQGEATRALLLDAAGSAAAEEAAATLERRIRGGKPARRFSPGYGAWPITAQRALFELLPHEEIEVRLLPSCLMTPRKSVSFAVWLGEEDAAVGEDACGPARCEICGLTSCAYRERPLAPEAP
jgi:hypothetical protein